MILLSITCYSSVNAASVFCGTAINSGAISEVTTKRKRLTSFGVPSTIFVCTPHISALHGILFTIALPLFSVIKPCSTGETNLGGETATPIHEDFKGNISGEILLTIYSGKTSAQPDGSQDANNMRISPNYKITTKLLKSHLVTLFCKQYSKLMSNLGRDSNVSCERTTLNQYISIFYLNTHHHN